MKCPDCNLDMREDGTERTGNSYARRYVCSDCGRSKVGNEYPVRNISGNTITTRCYCPICKTSHVEMLPIEFLKDNNLWTFENKPCIVCHDCRNKRLGFGVTK